MLDRCFSGLPHKQIASQSEVQAQDTHRAVERAAGSGNLSPEVKLVSSGSDETVNSRSGGLSR
jgi:hypothetical protein